MAIAKKLITSTLAAISLALPLSALSSPKPKIVNTPPRGPLRPFVIDMVATLKPNTGPVPPSRTFHDVQTNIVWHGHKATQRETAVSRAGGTEFFMWAKVIFDAKTLLPYFSEYRRADGLFVRHEFDGVHVKETRTIPDVLLSPPLAAGAHIETTSSEFDLPEPAFTWVENTGLPILLALPLRQGFAGSVPVISGESTTLIHNRPCTIGPCSVLRMTYRVVGVEDMSGISKVPVRSWKISVPETGFTFWIACKHPRLIQVNWPGPGGNGTFSMSGVKKTSP